MSAKTAAYINRKSTELLGKCGYGVGRTQYWQATPYSKLRPGVRVDLFGCIDLLAVPLDGPDRVLRGIQITTGSQVSNHKKKALGLLCGTREGVPFLPAWLWTGATFEIWGWRKNSKGRWVLTIWAAMLNGKGEVYFEKSAPDNEGDLGS